MSSSVKRCVIAPTCDSGGRYNLWGAAVAAGCYCVRAKVTGRKWWFGRVTADIRSRIDGRMNGRMAGLGNAWIRVSGSVLKGPLGGLSDRVTSL